MLAEQVRSGLIETVHNGSLAVVDVDGDLVAWSGDVDRPFYFRSAAKPFQAAVCNRLGAALAREKLALACASHDAEPVHVGLVHAMLTEAGLSEDQLACPPAWPLRPSAARRVAAAGEGEPRRIWNNCSGKHSAMLRAVQASGWDLDGYLSPEHPLQREIATFMRELAGPVEPIGIDGCGAPVFTTTAKRMAQAFARLGHDEELAPVFDAMHAYPALVSGYGNVDAAIATHLNAAAKRGAAGCLGVAIRGGYGIAVKAWDGELAAAGVALVATLDQLGMLTDAARSGLRPIAEPAVYGGGEPVGRFQSRLELSFK